MCVGEAVKQYKKMRHRSVSHFINFGEAFEEGYKQALQNTFLLVWESIPYDGRWTSERDIVNAYLDILSKSDELRKEWPETERFVKWALNNLFIEEMLLMREVD